MSKQKVLLPVIALTAASILWGINFPIIKLGVATIPVLIFIAFRFFVSSMILLPFAIKSWKPLKRKDLLTMVLASIMWIAFTAVTLNTGLKYAPSINAGVINLLGPLILAFFSVEFLKERMSFKAVLGALVAFAGAAVIIGKPWEISLEGESVMLGNILFFASMLGAVISTLLAKPVMKKMSSYQAAFMFLFPGVLCVIPLALTQIDGWSISDVSKTSFLALIYSISAITLANLFYMYGLKYKPASSIGIFTYLESVSIFVAAWFILGERPSATFALGAALVFAGIYLAEFHLPHKRKHKATRHKWYGHFIAKFH